VRAWGRAIVDALPLRPDSRVLEIGCGPGAAARAVEELTLAAGEQPYDIVFHGARRCT
jgi:cyclopropane fatty-acyl-phospholipid synthase-like methyltransferase